MYVGTPLAIEEYRERTGEKHLASRLELIHHVYRMARCCGVQAGRWLPGRRVGCDKHMRKIVIIGVKGYRTATENRNVASFPWDELTKVKNLADYDIIILNLPSITSTTVDWSAFTKMLNLETMKDVLRHEGQFIVIGDPRFMVPISKTGQQEVTEQPFLFWTGMSFYWDPLPGNTVDFKRYISHPVLKGPSRSFDDYDNYVGQLKSWKYSLRAVEPDLEALGQGLQLEILEKPGAEIKAILYGFATNRYKSNLAFSVNLFIGKPRNHYGTTSWESIIEFGPIIFLPDIGVGEDETLRLVLNDVCKVQLERPEPEWVEKMKAPGQEAVDREIERLRSEAAALIEKMDVTQARKTQIRQPLKLLYDGGDSLEQTVRDVFRRLGAIVEDPTEPGKEDGWLTVGIDGKSYEAVLEIKGTEKPQFSEVGLRQLMEWKNRGIQLREKCFKGIFVGNNAIQEPPGQRLKKPFSNQWIKTAKLAEIAALLSKDLFAAYVLHESGRLDTNEFWRRLFSTNGVVDSKWI